MENVERIVLANGITVIAIANTTADIVAGRLFFRQAGQRVERPEQAGIASLVATLLTKGTATLSAAEIADKIESVGAGLGTDAASDYLQASFKTISADFEAILQLLAELLRAPGFPEREVELERSLAIQSIRAENEQPFNVALRQLRAAMYAQHPYGVPLLGREETVAGLTVDDLRAYHRAYFRPDRLIISLAGNLPPARAVAAVEAAFGDWAVPLAPEVPAVAAPTLVAAPYCATQPQPTQQVIVMLGYLASDVTQDDYPALKLLNTYLGNGLSSRLFVELREKRGLAYDVSAFYPTRLDRSQFVTYMGTAPENVEIAIAGLQQEVDRLCQAPLPAAEWQTAQNKLLGQYALGKQSNAQMAQLYGWYETLGLGIDFDREFQARVAATTAAEAYTAACKHFAIAPYISLVGPPEAIALEAEE
ncbi:MAG: pitrilysin family protein [Cyanobacteria bacterium J06641_5]